MFGALWQSAQELIMPLKLIAAAKDFWACFFFEGIPNNFFCGQGHTRPGKYYSDWGVGQPDDGGVGWRAGIKTSYSPTGG